MKVIYCSDPFNTREVDSAYAEEAEAAATLGIPFELISFEALVNEKNPEKAVRRVSSSEQQMKAVYRGWMLTIEQYRQLYNALLGKNVRLINSPAEYEYCHYLPPSLPLLESNTPRTVSLSVDAEGSLSREKIADALKAFGDSPIIVKDFVKSRKHEWFEACFIASASDESAAMKVINTFIERQGEDLQGGLVLREYVEFEPIGTHPQSGMPLTKEYRIFFLVGEPVYWVYYWEVGDYESEPPPLEMFRGIAEQVESNFFTMDLAKLKGGGWTIVELGDGQVAGLPELADAHTFYREMEQHWNNKS